MGVSVRCHNKDSLRSVVSDDGVFHLIDGDIDCESGNSAYGS